MLKVWGSGPFRVTTKVLFFRGRVSGVRPMIEA